MTTVDDTIASPQTTPAGQWNSGSAESPAPSAAVADPNDRASEIPTLVRVSRGIAVALTAAIAVSSFLLSFAALSDLARRTGSWTGWLPYLWPGIVDGAIVLATLNILTTAPYPDQRSSRQFYWAMPTLGSVVSIGGNALHAILPAASPLPSWLAFAVACVPPAGILGSTHAVQILWRFDPAPAYGGPIEYVPATGEHVDRGQRWLGFAREIHQRGRLTTHSEDTLAQALWRLFEVRPAMSLRAIGEEVGVSHHDVIARIRQIAVEVVRERRELAPMAVAIEGQPGLAS